MARERRITSFDTFSHELENLEPEVVAIQSFRSPARGLFRVVHTAAVGMIGDIDYGLRYSVRGPNKNRVYREPLFTAEQSEYGLHDRPDRNRRAMAALLAGEIRVGQLSVILAGTAVYLAYPEMEPIPQVALDELHKQAREYKVEAAEFIV